MSEPVLVIHGIATREEGEFLDEIFQFNKSIGEQWDFIPVFWGHEGAQNDYTINIMPNFGFHDLPKSEDAEGFLEFIENFVGEIQGVIEESAEKIRQIPRMLIYNMVLPFIGDVILYQGARSSIHEAIWNCVPDGYGTQQRPISVIAHSIGGVISFDMAVADNDPLWIKQFITLGSQPSFFHTHSRRSNKLYEFKGSSVLLPPSIGSWANIWDKNDWLAFGVSGVFTLHGGRHPTEHPIQQFDSLFDGIVKSHTDYWKYYEVINIVREILKSGTLKLTKQEKV